MGIMPSDREQQWQRLFRRFSLPTQTPAKDSVHGGAQEKRNREGESAGKQSAPPTDRGKAK